MGVNGEGSLEKNKYFANSEVDHHLINLKESYGSWIHINHRRRKKPATNFQKNFNNKISVPIYVEKSKKFEDDESG